MVSALEECSDLDLTWSWEALTPEALVQTHLSLAHPVLQHIAYFSTASTSIALPALTVMACPFSCLGTVHQPVPLGYLSLEDNTWCWLSLFMPPLYHLEHRFWSLLARQVSLDLEVFLRRMASGRLPSVSHLVWIAAESLWEYSIVA